MATGKQRTNRQALPNGGELARKDAALDQASSILRSGQAGVAVRWPNVKVPARGRGCGVIEGSLCQVNRTPPNHCE
jgi:hypothetical protein